MDADVDMDKKETQLEEDSLTILQTLQLHMHFHKAYWDSY